MRPYPILQPLALCAGLALTLNARAGDGTWTATAAAGNWGDPLNWQGGSVADASGSTATFSTDIAAATTVTLDGARSVSNLVFSDNGAAGSPWTVTHASNKLTLAGGSPTITATTDTTISAIIDGTAGLVKNGAGILALTTKTNTYSGGTTVDGGILTGSTGIAFNGTQGGSFGTGNITVNSGATLKASGFFVIGGGQNTTRVLNLAGGTLNLQSAGTGGEYLRTINMTGGAITFDSGAIYFRAPNGGITLNSLASSQSSTVSTQIDLTLGSIVVDTAAGSTANGQDLIIGGAITQNTGAGSGAKTVTKNGTGTLVLSGACSYSGATTVNAGTLLVNGTLNAAAGSTVSVAGNSTLGGTGTINRATTLATNSTLAPGGNAIGTLSINGALTLQGKTLCQIDKTNGVLSQDQLYYTTGTLIYGGALEVTATGEALVSGDSFKLFDATSYGDSFSSFSMPTLPSGLNWDFSKLAVDGTVTVVNYVGIPAFTPVPGGYAGSPSVTLSSDAGATIYYTLNGSTPTASSPVYNSPINVPANTVGFTIKAFAKKASQTDSPVATGVYNTVSTPTWIANGNGFWSSQPGDDANWQNSVVASGSDTHADFSTRALTLSSVVTLDGSRSIGHMAFGDASPTPASDWLLDSINGSTLTLLAGTGTPSITINNQTTTISAALAGTHGFTKAGAGTLKLAGSQPYTGDTAVNAGSLVLDSSAVASNTAQLASAKISNNAVVSFYRAASGFTHINANLSGAGDYFVDGPGGGGLYDNRVAFRGTASDNTGTIYVVNNGRLWVDAAGKNAIGDSAIVDVGPTASFHVYKDVTETIGGLQGSGQVWGQDSSSTATLVVGGGDRSAEFSGSLKENLTKLAVTKIGTGTQSFNGANTYTGATSVEGGTLAGTGAAGSAFTLKSGATLSPGSGVGTMDTKALSFESGATLKVEINSTTGTADKVVAHGAVSLAGATASFAELGAGPIAPGTKLVILDYSGQALTGSFAGLAEGASVSIGANSFTLRYADESKVTLTEGSAAGFNAWASTNAPGQPMEMDHDHDGVPNGIEYFMGLSGTAFTPNPTMNAARLISWPKGAGYSGVYGTDYVVQTSINLSAWTDVPQAGVAIDADSVDYTVPAGEAKKFARLKVTGP